MSLGLAVALAQLGAACGPDPQTRAAPTPGLEEGGDVRPVFDAVNPDDRGMVPVSAGWVLLGPRHTQPVGGDRLEPPDHPSPAGDPPSDPDGPGLDTRQMGFKPFSGLSTEGAELPWRSTGGQRLEPRRAWVEAFRIDRTEVTRRAYKSFVDATGYRWPHVDEPWASEDRWNWVDGRPPPGTEDHPVVLTSWYDASEYCSWRGARLPTEAEWQLAALGPEQDGRLFPWGTDYSSQRHNHGRQAQPNHDDGDGYAMTSPVGAFPAGRSWAGLEDSFGNAWEYTSDWRVDSWELYDGQQERGGWRGLRSAGPGIYVAVRGGSYFFDLRGDVGGERNHFLPELRRKTAGFRCAADS